MPPKKRNELESTQKRLTEAIQKLERIVAGRSYLRGSEDEKAQKIVDLQKNIVVLEQKLSTLKSAASDRTTGQSGAHSGPSNAVQIIQNMLSYSSFGSLQTKREELEVLLPMVGDGPGSEHDPMQIDCDISEGTVNRITSAQSHDVVMQNVGNGSLLNQMSIATAGPPVESVATQMSGLSSWTTNEINDAALRGIQAEERSISVIGIQTARTPDHNKRTGTDCSAIDQEIPFGPLDTRIAVVDTLAQPVSSVQDSLDIVEGQDMRFNGTAGEPIMDAIGNVPDGVVNPQMHDAAASDNNDGFATDWFWNGKCEVDEEIYSIHIKEYRPESLSIEEPTPTSFDVESPKTGLLRQEWETQNAEILHFGDQLKDLKLKQQSLFQALSYGFNGDLKRTLAHVSAISRACRDIGEVEHRIADLSNHAKAKHHNYLASRNEDLQLVLIDAKVQLSSALDRLATIDSTKKQDIETEQGIIRLSKERIALLEKEVQAHEMNDLITVAKKLPDLGDGSDPPVRSRKGKRKAEGKQKSLKQVTPAVQVTEKSHLFIPTVKEAILETRTFVSAEPSDDAARALKCLDLYLKTNKDKNFQYGYRKQAREDVEFFPDASFTSMEVTRLVFSSSMQSLCEYHRKGKDNFRPDTVLKLFGTGFRGQSVEDSSKVTEPHEGHLHCGCSLREVAMEFFLWKTTRAFSSNPSLAGRSFAMEELSKLKPSTRAFWIKSLHDYTGLQTEDLVAPDYGTQPYAIRIALIQLHNQIERLRMLGAPLCVEVVFPDIKRDTIPEDLKQYGIESGLFVLSQQVEAYWGELKLKRQVFPLPFITPTRNID